jgi:hypothetical protein
MPTFVVPTYEVPIGMGDPKADRLWRYIGAINTSRTVIIDTSGVATPSPGAEGLVDPDDIFDAAQAGSGDGGKSVFRQGRTYTVTSTEETQLVAAGYTVSP